MTSYCSVPLKCMFYCFVFTMTFCGGIELPAIEEPDLNIIQPNRLVNFVYLFADSLTWNEARTVCKNLGGDLAKLDSQELWDIISDVAFENYHTDIFSHDYWVGLVEMTEGNHRWVSDCSPLTFGENYPAGWKDNELCFRVKKADGTGERVKCDTGQAMLCQITTDIPCSYKTRVDSRFLSMTSNISTCKSQCSGNADCWAAVEMYPDTCIMLAHMDLGQGLFHLSSKFCVNVTRLGTEQDVSDNDSLIPDNNCSLTDSGSTSTISPTPSSTLASTSSAVVVPTTSNLCPSTVLFSSITSICLTETSTVTSFVTELSSVPFDVTQTVNVTQTVYNTEHINVTLTETVTNTEFYNVTQTVYLNSSTEQNNYTSEQAKVVAEEFVKNLTINSKKTSTHLRKLNSADDKRASAKYMGTIGVISVVVPIMLLFLSDVRTFFKQITEHSSSYFCNQDRENTF